MTRSALLPKCWYPVRLDTPAWNRAVAGFKATTDTYSHVLPALAKEAAERMGKTLWG
jgi:hypothetical protein